MLLKIFKNIGQYDIIKLRKKSAKHKILRVFLFVCFFQDDLTSLSLQVLQINKTCTANTVFFKIADFHICVHKNYKVKEDFSKIPLNFSLLKFTYLGIRTYTVKRV